jgi:N-acetylglucosamine-6-sulfatase
MIAYAPGRIKSGTVISDMIQNIDVAPTFLELAGIKSSEVIPRMDGSSFSSIFSNKKIINPRKHILYEYHWEWNFPATPTCLAIRTNKYKYIYYHGIWDRNGLYDLEHDPNERHNLIQLPQYKEITTQLRNQLFSELESSGGLNMPIRPPKGEQFYDRKLR